MNYSVSIRYDRSHPVGAIRLPVIVRTTWPVTGKLNQRSAVFNNVSFHDGVFLSLPAALNAVREFTGKKFLIIDWHNANENMGEYPVIQKKSARR